MPQGQWAYDFGLLVFPVEEQQGSAAITDLELKHQHFSTDFLNPRQKPQPQKLEVTPQGPKAPKLDSTAPGPPSTSTFAAEGL